MLGTTKWDQSYNPYNAYCPEGMPHAGCSATAMAQVSSYYKSPKSVFYGDNIEENPLNKGFQLNLNWDLINSTSNRNYGYMPEADYFFDHTNTPNVSQQIGLYIRYVGKIVNANYKPTGTSATFNNIIKFMRNIIGLQATDQHQFNRKNIYNQIKGGNLVVLAGSANSTGGLFPSRSDGHMWIADGVFVSDHDHYYFHYNWGWSGQQIGRAHV